MILGFCHSGLTIIFPLDFDNYLSIITIVLYTQQIISHRATLEGFQMLVLTRKLGKSLINGDDIKITVEKINKSQIKLSIDAPKNVTINNVQL